jgi:hypothetical protein
MKLPYTISEIDKLRLKQDIEKSYMFALVDYILRKYGMHDMADKIKQERKYQ